MERTKLIMGNSTHSQMSSASDRLDMNRSRLHPMTRYLSHYQFRVFMFQISFLFRSSGPVSYGFASLDNSAMLDTETICSVGSSSGIYKFKYSVNKD